MATTSPAAPAGPEAATLPALLCGNFAPCPLIRGAPGPRQCYCGQEAATLDGDLDVHFLLGQAGTERPCQVDTNGARQEWARRAKAVFHTEGCAAALAVALANPDRRLLLCLSLGSPRPFPEEIADCFPRTQATTRALPETTQVALAAAFVDRIGTWAAGGGAGNTTGRRDRRRPPRGLADGED